MGRYLDAARSGDWETGFGFFADDVVLHVPGRSDLAGELARAHHAKVEVELVEMLIGEERVALIVKERFPRDEGVVEIRRANVYRVRAGKIDEVWIFEANQYEVDEFFG